MVAPGATNRGRWNRCLQGPHWVLGGLQTTTPSLTSRRPCWNSLKVFELTWTGTIVLDGLQYLAFSTAAERAGQGGITRTLLGNSPRWPGDTGSLLPPTVTPTMTAPMANTKNRGPHKVGLEEGKITCEIGARCGCGASGCRERCVKRGCSFCTCLVCLYLMGVSADCAEETNKRHPKKHCSLLVKKYLN